MVESEHPCFYWKDGRCKNPDTLVWSCHRTKDTAYLCDDLFRRKHVKKTCDRCGKPLVKDNKYCKSCRHKVCVEGQLEKSRGLKKSRGRFRRF